MTSNPRYGTIDTDRLIQMSATTPAEDGPVWMVNLMKFRDVADYPDDPESTISGRDADKLYAPLEILDEVGAKILFLANVEQQVDGAPAWDQVVVVKYPTRRSFTEMLQRPDYQERHVHKEAGMETTIIVACQPIQAPATSEAQPADGEHGVVVLDLVRFDDADASAGSGFDMAAESLASRSFTVEGTIVGDGRRWDQVAFNLHPSTPGPTLDREAQNVSEAYTLQLDPLINDLVPSTTG